MIARPDVNRPAPRDDSAIDASEARTADRLVASVAIIIPVFDAQYLRDALDSVERQTRSVEQVIVVDDGCESDIGPLVAKYPRAVLLRQSNKGPAAARNAGVAVATTDYVLFLDADDALHPQAIEALLACLAENPDCGIACGGYRKTDAQLRPTSPTIYIDPGPSAYRALLLNNIFGMLSTNLCRREILVQCGGFDESLRSAEDYDLHFRLSRATDVAITPTVVAYYRLHGSNTYSGMHGMHRHVQHVVWRNRPAWSDPVSRLFYWFGRWQWSLVHAKDAWNDEAWESADIAEAERRIMAREAPFASFVARTWSSIRRRAPDGLGPWLRRTVGPSVKRIGRVSLGDLARSTPISRYRGFDRGTPIDRIYDDEFLARHAGDIRGRVLEIGGPLYSERFGAGITRQDVLDVDAANPNATIVGDLADPALLPDNAFDCLVLTHTLYLFEDLDAVIGALHRALKPGGTALVTLPGISTSSGDAWGKSFMYSFTQASARRLFGRFFGEENVEVESFGNVYAAICQLHGLAAEEVDHARLRLHDSDYPVLICVRARKAARSA